MADNKVTIILEDADIVNSPDSRVDILQQCLIVLQDSPLNKVFVHTNRNELISVSPRLQVPKSIDHFNSLLEQLNDDKKIKSDKNSILLKIIKNDLEKVLPVGNYRIGLSNTGQLVKLQNHLSRWKEKSANTSLVFHVGAISTSQAHGTINNVSEVISISPHNLTAAHCCAKLCATLANLYDII